MSPSTVSLIILILVIMPLAAIASTDEQTFASSWIDAAFLGRHEAQPPTPPGIEVRRQDYDELRIRQSVRQTPLHIGRRNYKHGIGTHSVSEIVVQLPKPGHIFEAQAGIDNNWDTAGERGSVTFAIDVAGKEVFRSGVRRGSDEPLPICVNLNGAKEFTLHVGDGGDGPGWDQTDWADAKVTFEDGKQQWLDEMPIHQPNAAIQTEIPFSFTYDGVPSSSFLATWRRTTENNGKRIFYTDDKTGLVVTCELTAYADFPAAEWVLHFKNTGSADTPIIENIHSLDARIAAPSRGEVTFHHSHGSTCTGTDFIPLQDSVKPSGEIVLAPNGGRSSDGVLPFFNLEWADGGVVGAVGWTGQWELRLARGEGRNLHLTAGQQTTHFLLHPGEDVRTPSVLLVFWQGKDPLRGHNLLRRLILAHHTPVVNNTIATPPITGNTWFTYDTGNGVTEKNQTEYVDTLAKLGAEGYWLDAGWFKGGWPAGAGNWDPKPEAFPNGLKPVADYAHSKKMKFVLWFEPERVNPASQIAKDHPEWVLHAGNGDGLFNLGDPAARSWLTDYLAKRIIDWSIDVYRNDFNIDPLRFWQAADASDRKGIAEIRYVEGLYSLWDELRRRKPGLTIDDCASGGRRIDLEMISRSYPLWRSDTQCTPDANRTWDQAQTAGLSLYVPLHSAGVWGFDPYRFRSVATMGTNLCMDLRKPKDIIEPAKRVLKEMKSLRPFYQGDYYPLTEVTVDEKQWCGWQLNRADLGSGFALFFRRAECPYSAFDAHLRDLQANAKYDVVFKDTGVRKTLKGSELANLKVELAKPATCVLIVYKKVGKS